MYRSAFLIAALLFIVASCRQNEKPLIKAEVLQFAKKIEISIEKKDAKMLDDAIDEKAFFKKMNLETGSDSRSFREGLKKGMKMGTKIIESLTEKGTYEFIKHYEKDNVHHLLFRFYDGGSINYHDYELKRTNGEPKVTDIYIYLTGENLSETLKNLFVQFKDDFKEADDGITNWPKQLPDIRTLIFKGRHQEALEIYNSIPQKVKAGRMFQIIHVEISSGLSDDEYNKAISEYETLYPNEPNMQLLLIDGYILRKDYDKALNAVNELDKMIDKDPLLDFYRAMCYTLLKNDAKRVECLERLVKNMPDFEAGILELLVDYLETSQFEKAKPLVDRFKSRSKFDQATLSLLLDQNPGYYAKYGTN